jgi:DNA-directed RNA polymerase subunit RPC12/RpoP
MPAMRITVIPTGDPTEELRIAAEVRRDLFAHSPVEIDPDNPMHGTHRDDQRRAYFGFVTQYPNEVHRVLRVYGHENRVEIADTAEVRGEPCQNCGNVAGAVLPVVCPNCGFRDISACAVCGHLIPRQQYAKLSGNLFRCPDCNSRVRLRFNDPMFLPDGHYNQPLVIVERAGPHHAD